MLIYDLFSFCSREREMRPGFYRAGYVTYTDLSYMLFFPRVRKQLLLEQFSIRVLAPRGAIFENRERYRSIYDRATLISGLQRVAISGMDARDESGCAISRVPIMRICLFEFRQSRDSIQGFC